MNMTFNRFSDFRGAPLTEEQLFKAAPSIFAVEKHDSRSDRFQPIPTIEILRGLRKEGFEPVRAMQSRTRDESRRDFTKHMIRLRHVGNDQPVSVGGTVFEIILKNGNDGTAAYSLSPGLFRVQCLNGMVAKLHSFEDAKVRHTGTAQGVMGKVIDGTYEVLKTAETVLAAPQDWSQMTMSRPEAQIMARAAHALRFDDPDAPIAQAIEPDQFLRTRRRDDQSTDLWTTFNVVQENVIRGGLHGYTRDEQGRRRNTSTRPVTGVDQDIKLNRALWIVAEEMARLKNAA